jgi:NAD(P)-dependent dehydrogenase (short-subunit alcohol dehydrogenase family)
MDLRRYVVEKLLSGKVCVLTGGAGSIGLATARLFLAEGARVTLVDRDEQRIADAVAELGSPDAASAVADVSDARDMEACFRETVERWGKVDVIFSNAGNFGAIAPIAEYPESDLDQLYSTHVKGAMLTCKYGVPVMNDGGSIIITSSVAGLRGDPGVYAYITVKHAQVGFMRALAKELAPRRIRVNTLHPGPVDNGFQKRVEDKLSIVIGADGTQFFNQMIPLGRHARPDEIALSVLYLASDMSSFTTGSQLVVDGGMSG